MTPSRPYLLRALYNWILDNKMTPHVVINADFKGVIVPTEYVEDGQIILSVAPESVYALEMNNNYLAFAARFSGISRDIYLPVMSITAIYAEENRKGMVFAEEEYDRQPLEPVSGGHNATHRNDINSNKNLKSIKNKSENKSRPKLKIVSSNPDPDDKDNNKK